MAVSLEVLEEARHLIRGRLRTFDKRGRRTHPEALLVLTAQLNALTHPCCSGCENLFTHNQTLDGKETPILECDAHRFPVDLWRDRAPGEKVTCEDFTPVGVEVFSRQT